MEYKYIFSFETPDRLEWIANINNWRDLIIFSNNNEIVQIVFEKSITKSNFDPIHIVLLSCFIEEIKQKGYKVLLSFSNVELSDFISKDIEIKKYWVEERIHHVESPKIADLNLWRITDEGKEFYSISIHDYFKRSYFTEYDLSTLQNSLNELYFNIFDHARANGNAFSYIRYDQEERKIKIAICDFGKGIARTLREKYLEYKNDCIALENSIKKGISSRTQIYNRGFGLESVISSLGKSDTLRIVSNQALLVIKGAQSEKKIYSIEFDFEGTLIYFDISIDNFEKEEIIIDDFSF